MIKKQAGIALATTLLLAGCATDRHIASVDQTVEKQGVFVLFEYSYFRASDGDVFVLLLPNPRDQKRFATLARLKLDTTELCLAMRIEGGVNGKVDDTNRPFFVVSKLVAVRQVQCGNLS